MISPTPRPETPTPHTEYGLTPYVYYARLSRVIDGDTVDLDLDFGYDFERKQVRVRLLDVDTAEVHGVSHDSAEYDRGSEHSTFTQAFFEDAATFDDPTAPAAEWPLLFDSHGYKRGSFQRALGYLHRRSDGTELTVSLLDEFGPEVGYEED